MTDPTLITTDPNPNPINAECSPIWCGGFWGVTFFILPTFSHGLSMLLVWARMGESCDSFFS